MAKSKEVQHGIGPPLVFIEAYQVPPGSVGNNPADTGQVSRSLGSYRSPMGTQKWNLPSLASVDADTGDVGVHEAVEGREVHGG